MLGMVATLLVGLGGLAAAPAAASAHLASRAVQHLAVTSLSFAKRTADVTAAPARVRLRWTITDSGAGARSVSGTLTIAAPEPGHPGRYVSQQVSVSFALKGSSKAQAKGTARKSSYSYAFDVPQYARVSQAHWQVVAMTVRDNKGDKLTLSASKLSKFKAVLTATEVVDTSGPTFVSVQLAGPGGLQYGYAVPQFAYSGKGAAPAAAEVCLHADPAGFASGSLQLTGPGGAVITTSFTAAARDKQTPLCSYTAEATYGQNYLFSVKFPAGTADGAWTPTKLTLTDAIGNVTTATDVGADAENTSNTVTVTADDVLTASQFAASPDPVDDWLAAQNVTVSMTTAGATGGISAIELQFANEPAPSSNCNSYGSVPVNGSGGQVSVTFTMGWEAPDCDLTGIAITDAAGYVAVYGSLYGAPDPGLNITQMPDTTPPVATSASLSLQPDREYQLTIGVTTQVAPVNSYYLYIYNSAGVLQTPADQFGGVTQEPPTGAGTLQVTFPVTALAPGTYSLGFTIDDEHNLSSSYGPGASPVPGGPLTFTVS
jgi:hypothetical protein